QINLEYAYYSKLIFRDVNNYIAVDTANNVKQKGIFEVKKPYHKNASNLIITKALEQHFIHGQNYKDYICNTDNSIYDYCAAVKQTKDHTLNLYKHINNATIVEKQHKV